MLVVMGICGESNKFSFLNYWRKLVTDVMCAINVNSVWFIRMYFTTFELNIFVCRAYPVIKNEEDDVALRIYSRYVNISELMSCIKGNRRPLLSKTFHKSLTTLGFNKTDQRHFVRYNFEKQYYYVVSNFFLWRHL